MAEHEADDLKTEFEYIVKEVAQIAQDFPDYTFESIQSFVDGLREGRLTADAICSQFSAILIERQKIGFEIFNYALVRAKQANYQPLNELDSFIEHQLYGVQDDKVVEKGLVGSLLRKQEQAAPPPPPKRPLAPRPGSLPTNPLNPRMLPQKKQD